MDELSIKITIANRIYPLKIKRVEEERVRKAAKILNDRIKEYEQQYAVSDKTDLITMCAMQFATEIVNMQEDLPEERRLTATLLSDIDSRISVILGEKNVH